MAEYEIEYINELLLKEINSSTTNIYSIYGGIRSGKTYLLKSLRCSLNNDGYSVLLLSNDDIMFSDDYSIFHSGINEVNALSNFAKDAFSTIISTLSKTIGNLSNLLLKLDNYMLSHILFTLNDTELEIIKRIYSISEKRNLVILADNIDQWDNCSIDLLKKIIELKYHSDISAFKDLFVITTQTIDKNSLTFKEKISIEIKNILLTDFLNKIENTNLALLSEEDKKNLYYMTEGNYGIIEDLMSFSTSIIDTSLEKENTQKLESLLKSIIKRKLELIDMDKNIASSLGYASVIGKKFDENLLMYLLEKTIYDVKIILNTAKNEHFLYEKKGTWKFAADYIYDYFLENLIEPRIKIHCQLADVLAQYVPSDLYNRYYHLKKSEQHNKAIDVLTVYCIRNIVERKYINSNYVSLINESEENFDVLYSIKEAFEFIHKDGDYIKARDIVNATDDYVNEIVIIERDYVLAFILYHCSDFSDFLEAETILDRIIADTTIDLYQWAKSATLLFLLCINRLNNYDKAKTIEKQIIYRISKTNKIDENLKILSNIIQRVSPCLYNTDVSYLKTKKSYTFFEERKKLYPKEFVMASTNFIAMCICSSKYDEALNISTQVSIFFTETFTSDFPRIFKFMNNCVLAKYLNKDLNEKQCYKRLVNICKLKPDYEKNKLLQNNKAVFLSFEDIDAALSIIQTLYYENKDNVHNDYYTYLFSINYIILLILQNDYDTASEVFIELGYLIPSICRNEKKIIISRYDSLKNIIDTKIENMSYIQLSESFREHLPTKVDDYWIHPFIISDCQYWSEF